MALEPPTDDERERARGEDVSPAAPAGSAGEAEGSDTSGWSLGERRAAMAKTEGVKASWSEEDGEDEAVRW
jgi:hypothetical protein